MCVFGGVRIKRRKNYHKEGEEEKISFNYYRVCALCWGEGGRGEERIHMEEEEERNQFNYHRYVHYAGSETQHWHMQLTAQVIMD